MTELVESRTKRKEEKVREEILSAAMELFLKYGQHKTSMDDIAKATGRAKSSLYYYFASKDEIFRTIATIELGAIIREVREAVAGQNTAEGKFRTFLTTRFRKLKERALIMGVLEPKSPLDPSLVQFARSELDRFEYGMFQEILSEGVRSGEFRMIDSELSRELGAFTVMSAVRGFDIELFIEHRHPDMWSKIDHLPEMFIQGLRV